MARIVDPQPFYKSIAPPTEEGHTKRTSITGIDADRPGGWWPGYVEGVIEALSRHDDARWCSETRSTSSDQPPRSSTRLI